MSLILEALRKSEAERRRGQAPGLFVEQLPVPARRRSAKPVWVWGLVVVLVGVLLAWGWREFGALGATSAGSMAGAASNAPAASPSAPVTTAVATTNDPMPAELATGDGSDSPQAPSSVQPPSVVAPRDAAGPAADSRAADAMPGPAAQAPPSEAPVAAAPVPPPVPAERTAPVDDAPEVSAPPRVAAPAIADSSAEPPLPRLSELTGDERSQLPALKLSMHVFAEDPAQRFVILDGRRLREGDSPAAGVVLEAIRRDGLVISVNGRRLLLARP
jgi:general secretion pathway protein B